jgi:L-alanine-DL-glutamate epimerase-like enolase superfamily enzyme
MKIKAIRATPVLIPLEAPYLWSFGALDGFTKCVVEVETTDGLIGIGEAPSHAAARVIDAFADQLVGCYPLDPDRLRFAANLLKERGIPNKYHDPDAPGIMRRMPLI